MGMRVFSDDHDRESPAVCFTHLKQLADSRDPERMLRNQNHISTAGNSAVRGDPPSVTAHHFYNHYAVMGLCGGMEAIYGVGNDRDRGVESKRKICAPDVVVDCLGNSDQLQIVIAGQ